FQLWRRQAGIVRQLRDAGLEHRKIAAEHARGSRLLRRPDAANQNQIPELHGIPPTTALPVVRPTGTPAVAACAPVLAGTPPSYHELLAEDTFLHVVFGVEQQGHGA